MWRSEWFVARARAIARSKAQCLCAFALFFAAYAGVCFLISVFLLPPLPDAFRRTMPQWPPTGAATLVTRFLAWDGAWYMTLVETGYEVGSPVCAFFPGWPALWRGFALITSLPGPAAGLVLATSISILAFSLLFHWVHSLYGLRVAAYTILALAMFPGSLFFHFPYTEPLFLLELVGLFWSLSRCRTTLAFGCALALPLTRSTGFFIALPLLVLSLGRGSKRVTARYALLGLICGIATYFAYMHLVAGGAWKGIEAQKFWSQNRFLSGEPFLRPFEGLRTFLDIQGLHEYEGSILDRLIFVATVWACFKMWQQKREEVWWVISLALIPGLFNSFVSYTRFVSCCVPLFWWGGQSLMAVRKVSVLAAIFGGMLMVHAWLLWRHLQLQWAG